MLKTFLNKTFHSEDDESDLVHEHDAMHRESGWLKSIIELFPIGKKQRYSPEYMKDIEFDTVILGYCINNHFLYSTAEIDTDDAGNPTFFHTGKNNQKIPVSHIDTFQLVVPDTSELEVKLDYERRAKLGRGRQFVKGNSISLISNSSGRGLSTIDTEVTKLVMQKEGPYAPAKLILLTPDFSSLLVTDQRSKARAKIAVPITISSEFDNSNSSCMIIDVSGNAVRIRVDTQMLLMPLDAEVILSITLPKTEQTFTIKGTVIRSFPGTRVIKLVEILHDGKYTPLGPIDQLELKACLMNY